MPTETIDMNADGTYQLKPPFVIITRGNQAINWKLTGANWVWQTSPPGIVCETTAPNPPYSPWPSFATGPTLNSSTNEYEADANSPNTGPDWVYYKWTFNVRNTSTGQVVMVDPDIGNDPKP